MSKSVPRKNNASVISILLFSFVLLLPGVAASQAGKQSLPVPNTTLQPVDVVKIILDALANNDTPYPDAGIETTFNFASPANKANTGPLERFTSMVKGPVFGSMVGHKSYEVSEVVMKEYLAYQVVRLITAKGATVHFAFRLGLQNEGEFKGMWMTEAVWPLEEIVEGIDV
ncbi:MAG: DUF4864 domain-containing protein [Gammaproteobacteria bacterium]